MTDVTIKLLTWVFILLVIGPPLLVYLSRWSYKAAKTAKHYDEGGWRFMARLFAAGSIVSVVTSVMLIFWIFNQVQSQGAQYETDLNAQYVQNSNILSTYVVSFEEQLGVAKLQEGQIKAIITEAVAGQTQVQDIVAPGKSPLFLAVSQAYPNVTLAQYTQLMNYIVEGRQKFQDGQSALLTDLSGYDHWQHSGVIVQPALLSILGFPSNLLHVEVGGKRYTGAAAEAQMWRIVENPVATAAFATSTQQALPVG